MRHRCKSKQKIKSSNAKTKIASIVHEFQINLTELFNKVAEDFKYDEAKPSVNACGVENQYFD